MRNLDKIGEDLFNKIRSRFHNVTIGDDSGNITNEPSTARFFEFDYSEAERTLGQVSISISEEDGLTIIYSDDFIQTEDDSTQKNWYNFLRDMRTFSKKRLMNFDVRNIKKTNLTKRDYKFLAANRSGEEKMTESKLYGKSRVSYQNFDEARLVIKHTQPIDIEMSGARTRNIGSIYIESSDGERFKYPFRHLSGARAMARHVAEGGKPYDDFGGHITSLSEELSKLRKFKSYVGRSAVMAESLEGYMDIVKERITTVKKTIDHLQRPAFYKETFEGFVKPVFEEVPDDVKENWIDELTIRQFNEELQDIFPYIYNLVKEGTKTKQLGPKDLLGEVGIEEGDSHGNSKIYDKCWDGYNKVPGKTRGEAGSCVKAKEEIEMEEHFNRLMGQFRENEDLDEAAVPPNYMMARIISQKISPGQKAIGKATGARVKGDDNKANLVKIAIFGHFQNPLELTSKTAEYKRAVKTPEDFIKAAQKVVNDEWYKAKGVVLFFTEGEMDSKNWAPYVNAIQELGDPKIQTNARETRAPSDGSKVKVINPNKDDDGSWAGSDARKTAPEQKKTYVFRLENDKLLKFLKQRQPDYIAKYYKTATNEFVMNQGTFEKFKATINGENYVKKFGNSLIMVNNEKSFKENDMPKKPQTPLSEFILSYLDRDSGQFPKGETAVLTMVEKDYGEAFIEPAKAFIEQINNVVAEKFGFRDPQITEFSRIKKLAGL